MDLATLIKPMLTAGELRVIGSTTFEEYKHIEKDRALARRLQKVAIEEPSVEEAIRILAGLKSRYEEYHRVSYTDAALEAAVKLAARHLRDYRLPDSAIDLLDEAGSVARLAAPARGSSGSRRSRPSCRSRPSRSRDRGRGRHRENRRPHRTDPGAPGVLVGSRTSPDA